MRAYLAVFLLATSFSVAKADIYEVDLGSSFSATIKSDKTGSTVTGYQVFNYSSQFSPSMPSVLPVLLGPFDPSSPKLSLSDNFSFGDPETMFTAVTVEAYINGKTGSASAFVQTYYAQYIMGTEIFDGYIESDTTFSVQAYPVSVVDLTTGEAIGSVPETSTWAMMLLGFGGLGALAYRRKHTTPSVAALA